jgi:hypothetical protein
MKVEPIVLQQGNNPITGWTLHLGTGDPSSVRLASSPYTTLAVIEACEVPSFPRRKVCFPRWPERRDLVPYMKVIRPNPVPLRSSLPVTSGGISMNEPEMTLTGVGNPVWSGDLVDREVCSSERGDLGSTEARRPTFTEPGVVFIKPNDLVTNVEVLDVAPDEISAQHLGPWGQALVAVDLVPLVARPPTAEGGINGDRARGESRVSFGGDLVPPDDGLLAMLLLDVLHESYKLGTALRLGHCFGHRFLGM